MLACRRQVNTGSKNLKFSGGGQITKTGAGSGGPQGVAGRRGVPRSLTVLAAGDPRHGRAPCHPHPHQDTIPGGGSPRLPVASAPSPPTSRRSRPGRPRSRSRPSPARSLSLRACGHARPPPASRSLDFPWRCGPRPARLQNRVQNLVPLNRPATDFRRYPARRFELFNGCVYVLDNSQIKIREER